jgi:hypothetical protein
MITASAISASREQTSPVPPPLILDVFQRAAAEYGHSVETVRASGDWTTRFILFHGKRLPREIGSSELLLAASPWFSLERLTGYYKSVVRPHPAGCWAGASPESSSVTPS